MKAKVEYIKLPKSSYSRSYRKIEVTRKGDTIELTLTESMDVVSFKLPPQLNAKLEEFAVKMKKTKSEIIREALEKYLGE
ncbi:CopG-like transcriptional repressor [Sulfolobus spindle-shaped virus 4]|uniref:Putative RHH protein, CopG family n=2 Tax=Alphafusellovirus TaxID=10475 RepID=A8TKJ5_9VIRU|nr:CopG-like transcriptional repressor [Sulfolobus spindle-shaped virus 4]YP_002221491.1 CopG-like transcriptional repressor [Sulfolobus spindle-shaped virus 5]ABV26213.1 putative RHH protein, CopG family [Sulfolobus spindle-shaped virus 4]ABV26247.1 putative RHH protein [Sulfolobus spindle-shaped virus 5]